MTKQEKLDKIYKVIADKTISFGCIVHATYKKGMLMEYGRDEDAGDTVTDKLYVDIHGGINGDIELSKDEIIDGYHDDYMALLKVIGHPVMIGDVLDWLYENKKECDPVYAQNPVRGGGLDLIGNNRDYVFHRFNKKREPIENQSDECIDYIYSLVN